MALGRLTVNYSLLEENFILLITALLGVDFKIGDIITCKQSFSGLLKLSDALFRQKIDDQELLEQLRLVINQASKCAERRNSLIHSMWYFADPEIGTVQIKKKVKIGKGFQDTFDPADVDDINDLVKSIEETVLAVTGLLIETERKGFIRFFDIPFQEDKTQNKT